TPRRAAREARPLHCEVIGRNLWPPHGGSDRGSLSLQFLLQFVHEPPISATSEELLRSRLEETSFAHTQGVEANGALRVKPAPVAIGQLAQHREGDVLALRGAPIRHHLSDLRRL